MSTQGLDTLFGYDADMSGMHPVHAGLSPRSRTAAVQFLPLVANEHVAWSREVIEQLCTQFVIRGRHALIVDAALTSPAAPAAAVLGLADCIQIIGPHLSYLAAGGLPRRYVDTEGSAGRLLQDLRSAAPQVNVVVVHAEAPDLARIFKGRNEPAILLATDEPESLKDAYASWKLLASRGDWLSARLLVAQTSPARTDVIAASLSRCAEQFMGGHLTGWAAVDVWVESQLECDPNFVRLAQELLGSETDRPLRQDLMPLAGRRPSAAALKQAYGSP